MTRPRVLWRADPNDNIHSFVDQLHQAIGKREIDRHLWMRANKVATDGADMGAAKRNRRAHPQHALRLDAAMRQHQLGFVDLCQDALGSVVESLPFFSQRKVTGAAGNETHLGPAFEHRKSLADDAERKRPLCLRLDPAMAA